MEYSVFTSYRCTVHDLKFSDSFAFVVLIRYSPCCLTSNNGEFHVFDLYANEKEVDLADNHVLEVISVCARQKLEHTRVGLAAYLDLLYSNSMCKQSSMPTSILILHSPSEICDT